MNVRVHRSVTSLVTRTETKNLNSFRAVSNAVEYEIKRQAALLTKGERIVQETRCWDETKQETFSQRSKEEAHDYRYFPEPDLPPVVVTEEMMSKAKLAFPEDRHPNYIRNLMIGHGLDANITETLIGEPTLAYLYLDVVVGDRKGNHRLIANWLTGERQAIM